jgi:predicted ATP-grasp superfamily ATP-dependent carboligase
MSTAIARSLYRHGIDVDVATFSALEPRVWSRAIRNFWRVPDPDVSPSDFATAIRKLIQEHGHDLLIPGNDVGLTAIVEHYESFEKLLQVGCPPPPTVERVLNKSLTLEAARLCGIRTPPTILVSNSAELPQVTRRLGFPIVVKPAEKKRTDEFKACVLRAASDIERLFPEPRQFSTAMLAQEFCRGEGVGIEMLMHEGKPIAVFQHRRLKELPHRGGVAVTAIAEIPRPDLVQSSVALLRALDWEGPAMVEFKVHQFDGTTFFMEVNGRYWGSVSLPILAGVDFPLYQWKLVHGEDPEVPSAYAVGMKWRWTAGWLSRYHGLMIAARRSERDREMLFRDLRHFAEDFDASTVDALFCSSDFMPGIIEFVRSLKDLAASDVRRMMRVFRPSAAPTRTAATVSTPRTDL